MIVRVSLVLPLNVPSHPDSNLRDNKKPLSKQGTLCAKHEHAAPILCSLIELFSLGVTAEELRAIIG